MTRWLLRISVTSGLAAIAAVLLWSAFHRQGGEAPQTEAPALSVSAPASPPGVLLTPEASPQPTTREAAFPTAAPVLAPPSLDPLFAALGMHRPVERSEAPDFTLPDVEGRLVRLRAFQGKLVFLNFWATWCVPCRFEMPSMDRLYQTFKSTEFVMLAISIDRQGSPVVKPFMEELKLTFPTLLDRTMEVARQYGLRGLPTTYLIDRNGHFIGAAVGGRDWSSVEAKALIAGLLRHTSTTASDPTHGRATEGK